MIDESFDRVAERLAATHSRRKVLSAVGKGTAAGAGMALVAGPLGNGIIGKPLTAAAQGSASVAIIDFAFDPGSVAVDAGGTVTWTNQGAVAHTVTANDGSFDSGSLAPGASFSHTFSAAGTFSYFCAFHTNMVGSVAVSGATAPADTSTATTTTAVPNTGSGPLPADSTPWLAVALAGGAAAWLAGRGLRKGAPASEE